MPRDPIPKTLPRRLLCFEIPSGREALGLRLVWNRLPEALASYGGCVPDPSPKTLPGELYLESIPLSLIFLMG